MFSRWLWPHVEKNDYLAPADLARLRQAVLDSPYLADSELTEGFAGTYGFSILFHREEIPRLLALMPELKPFLDKVLRPQSNVLFLNPLVIKDGQGVDPHADKTLISYVEGEDPPFPFCVSVLYLQIPKLLEPGGQLVFHRWFGKLVITPAENALVEFPGSLLHQVTPVSAADKGADARISLVLEQYDLSARLKAKVTPWCLETARPFDEFLAEATGEETDPPETSAEASPD